MKRRTLLLLMLLAMGATSAWAQIVYHGYTANSGTAGQSGQGYGNLVDGQTSTKWCVVQNGGTWSTTAYIEFQSEDPIILSQYVLTTANDNATYTGRNPKNWKIMAKVNSSDANWTTLADVTGNTTMQNVNYTPYTFNFTNTSALSTAYKYFRFEISAIQSGGVMQLSELHFIATVQGDDSHITEIATKADWEEFCQNVNSGYSYANKLVTLTADVGSAADPIDPITTICGTYTDDNNYNAFKGTFDGGGHTLYFELDNMGKFSAPFKIVEGATIRNLRTDGYITGNSQASAELDKGKVISGLVAISRGTTNIIGCSSSMSLTSYFENGNDVTLAGLVASTKGGNLTVEGCAFEGSMTAGTTTPYANHNCGIVAYPYTTVTVTVRNTVFAPWNLDTKDDDDRSWTFARKKDNTTTVYISNCYYTKPLTSYTDNIQGTKIYSVTGETGVTVAMNGTANPVYDGSGLSFYSPGLTFTNKDNNTIVYGANNNNVSLALSTTNSGHQRFLASAGTLTTAGNPYTLTMPANAVTISSDYKTFITNGNWNTANCWSPAEVPTLSEDVKIDANVTIPSGVVATANNITVNSGKTLTIAEGGQLKHNNSGVNATMQKSITAYTETAGKDNYYLMALPFASYTVTGSPLVTTGYNLYTFDGSYLNAEWRWNPGSLANGQGFLYANRVSGTLSLSGTLVPSNDVAAKSVSLNYNASTTFGKWNLVGNPFACNVTSSITDYYVIDKNNDDPNADLIAASGVISPLQGIFVQATGSGQSVIFTPSNGTVNAMNSSVNLGLKPADTRDAKVIDLARVRFNDGEGLEKFQLDPNHTKLYFPQDGMDYAVVHSQAEGELPLNLKVENNGRYTLSAELIDVEMGYLHLIDNLTGADVDLLATPSYTFNACTTDYASRFKLVFAATGIEENGASTGSATFAYYNGSEWVINNPSTGSGSATLQVIDVLGHVLSSETISGATTKAIHAAPGIYMLRLINGDNVRVQKVVVR